MTRSWFEQTPGGGSPAERKAGWLCGYTPVEILHAAGLTPVRLYGSGEPVTRADSYMHPNMCPYVRQVLDAALDGGFAGFAGVVFVNSCDAMRRLSDVFRSYVDAGFNVIIDAPRSREEQDISYYRNELARLKKAVEASAGVEITDEALRESTAVYRRARETYAKLGELRKSIPPRVSGAEMVRAAKLFFSMRPEEWTAAAEAALASALTAPLPASRSAHRVLLSGNMLHGPEMVEMIESRGIDVVFDDVCSGARHFELPLTETTDPLGDLARAYLFRPCCARMMDAAGRAERTLHKMKEYGARGVIHHTLKFCDTYQYDVPAMKAALDAAGVRSLFIEGDCTAGGSGQLATRLDAFAEMLD